MQRDSSASAARGIVSGPIDEIMTGFRPPATAEAVQSSEEVVEDNREDKQAKVQRPLSRAKSGLQSLNDSDPSSASDFTTSLAQPISKSDFWDRLDKIVAQHNLSSQRLAFLSNTDTDSVEKWLDHRCAPVPEFRDKVLKFIETRLSSELPSLSV